MVSRKKTLLVFSRLVLVVLAAFFTASLYQFHVLQNDLIPTFQDGRMEWFLEGFKARAHKKRWQPMATCNPSVACLNCAAYGGPYDADALEDVVYWKDIPRDAEFQSVYNAKDDRERYLTFELDVGGFNNVRMSAETAIMFAVVTGRTLVLPPEQSIWNMDKADHPDGQGGTKKHQTDFGMHDFFPLQLIQHEFPAFKWIRLEDYLTKVVMTGQLKNGMGEPIFPPFNRTNWSVGKRYDESFWEKFEILFPWMRSSGKQVAWSNQKCTATFPVEGGRSSHIKLKYALASLLAQDVLRFPEANPDDRWKKRVDSFMSHPTPVNASLVDRLTEMMADRKELCIYDESYQNASVLHLGGTEESGYRTLVPFYAFYFFENYHHDLWAKRFARDHLRFSDEIQCAAARIVAKVRQLSRQHNASYDGQFDTMHVRRNDFSNWAFAAEVVMSAENLYDENTRDMFREGRTVYVATDEKNLTFFNPLGEHYHLLFLNDFKEELRGLNPNYYGMVDQLVAARGSTFAGTFLSTFSAYINRIRGYHAQIDKVKGYSQGTIDSYYITRPHWFREKRDIMQYYKSIENPYWFQEFPTAWRDIDHDLDETDIIGYY